MMRRYNLHQRSITEVLRDEVLCPMLYKDSGFRTVYPSGRYPGKEYNCKKAFNRNHGKGRSWKISMTTVNADCPPAKRKNDLGSTSGL